MKIIQMSDFHISENTNWEETKHKIDKLYDSLIINISDAEEIIFCICGDITDKGSREGYVRAEMFFDYICYKFEDYQYYFEFTPGNHDLVDRNFGDFNQFIEKYISKGRYDYTSNNIVIRDYGDIRLVLVNSSFHKNTEYGLVDIAALKECYQNGQKNSIIIMHHTLVSRYEDDISQIRNAYEFINIINENKVCALLHGHTHGYGNMSIGNECLVIGVGPMLKNIENVNNQFNLVDIRANDIYKVENFAFRSDMDKFVPMTIYNKRNINCFQGSKLGELYDEVLNSTKEYQKIDNFNMNLVADFKDFTKDIETLFKNYIGIAAKWLEEDIPDDLYYNHGMYINTQQKKGIDYVIEELERKSTSSRAILPLLILEDVIESGDGHLPSLDIIQFGFTSEDKSCLKVTLYLRSLEVNHFLKINLCEVYLMAKEIIREIRTIKTININVISFKAQYLEEYGCFKKAKIDIYNSAEIMMIVTEKDIKKIIELLKDKLQIMETVINDDGVKNLLECITIYQTKKGYSFYNSKLIKGLESAYNQLIYIKELRIRTSAYEEIKEEEKKFRYQLNDSIEAFQELDRDIK